MPENLAGIYESFDNAQCGTNLRNNFTHFIDIIIFNRKIVNFTFINTQLLRCLFYMHFRIKEK